MNTTAIIREYRNTTVWAPYMFATEEQNTLLWVFVVIAALIGTIANAIVFVVITRNKTLRENPFNIILMSLCVSDFLSAVASPIMYYKSGLIPRDYNLPEWTCKLAVMIDHWTTIATVHHILATVIYRVLVLNKPKRLRRINSKHVAALMCFIWIESFATSGWYPMVGMEIEEASDPYTRSCFMSDLWIGYGIRYSKYYLPIAFVAPVFVIVILSIYILHVIAKIRRIVRERSRRDLRRENRALLHICFIVGSFIVGYSPEIAFRINVMRGADFGLTVYAYDFFRFILLRISESLNPFFYTLCSRSIRTACYRFLIVLCCRCCPTNSSKPEEMQSPDESSPKDRQTTSS